jgi:uncharacterized protein (TIGR03000 family)
MVTISFVVLLLSLAPLYSAPQPAPSATTAVLTITAPAWDARLELDGKPLKGTGATRTMETPPLLSGRTYQSTLVAKWEPNTYTKMTRTKVLTVRAGDRLTIDLTVDDPADRVTVLYVPTPDFVVAEMIRLAGITASDVTYEPGVGDARITIAAVRGGARRAVGIDLDPERVAESRENVKAAGLSDRIDIRLGDALDQPDLGSMTVVLLYMGDHFNMLIRPHLWKQLPIGARVVSHRFKMGDDWPPDKTVAANDDYGIAYDVHVWTITEALKRRQ